MVTKFQLSKNFINKYEDKEPNWGYGDLSKFVFMRTYSRTLENGLKETPFQVFKRVVEGTFQLQLDHCTYMGLPWDAAKAQRSAQEMFRRMWAMKFLPPGRGLWMQGTDKVSDIGSAALCNCGFVSTKDITKDPGDPFAWACDMLMLGVGIGFDTLGAGKFQPFRPDNGIKQITIEDSREGWVNAIKRLINSYTSSLNPRLVFDYSEIRPAGSLIKGFGGTASGYKPLKEGIENIRKILNIAALSGRALTAVDITDIMNFIGKFVVAGNVRRSAELAIGSEEDKDFQVMKDWKLFPEELKDRRWASNNSLSVNESSNFEEFVDSILLNGEPGLVFLTNSRKYGRLKDGVTNIDNEVMGFNPCVEITLHDRELCNLVESFPANHDSAEDYYETIKYAYLYAKSVTLLRCHNPESNSAMLRNRRIGLSQSGIQQAIKKFGTRNYFKNFCDKAYEVVSEYDNVYSRWLGIPRSIKMTTVKPSGTVSLLAGATPGVHCTHSEYYMRTVRIANTDPLLEDLRKAGYKIEESITDREHTSVVYFPVKENNYTKSKYDISIWEQLALVKELQYSWADNSVSVTVTIRPGEEDQLLPAIEYYAPYLKSVSFLPLDNHNYEQAPYSTITEDEYKAAVAMIKPLEISVGDDAVGSKFCEGDRCEI